MASLPLFYEGNTLEDMERKLRNVYLKHSGWLESADKKLSIRDGAPIPWFTYAAISFLEKNIPDYANIFEYGGGHSTLYWANRVERVVSIDHDAAFVEHVSKSLPENASFSVVEEGPVESSIILNKLGGKPELEDPERTEKTYRSGQLNNLFENYALQVLDFPDNDFDVIIIDGVARVLSTWAAIRHLRKRGFIVFDNSDREMYAQAYAMLDAAGYRRIDFWGMGPINPYEWCTSVFYQPTFFSDAAWFPEVRKAIAHEEQEASDEFGIMVLGYNRPKHLQAVLESLRLQDKLGQTHVWIDGTQGLGEFLGVNTEVIEVAKRFDIKKLHTPRGHFGIDKMIVVALEHMSTRYKRVLIIEDDCFPTNTSIDLFEESLAQVSDRGDIFSVYGHHFGVEDEEMPDFPRFQGWGWAAHSWQLQSILPELRRLFLLEEDDYLAEIKERITPDIKDRLGKTPGRDVFNVLTKFYSWDATIAFLCAERKLAHRRTDQRCIYNNGITPGIGHFRKDEPRLRRSPLNMIALEESWQEFDRTTSACDGSAASYGLDELDKKIMEIAPAQPGFFVELGAFDGVTQSNSVLLENAGWKGLLIEANPGSFAKCVKTRPNCLVEHAACVASGYDREYVEILDVGLMSITEQSEFDSEKREEWLERGEGFAKRKRQKLEVPAATLSQILDKHNIKKVDLLLLDVEGAEVDVLKGLDFARHAPSQIVAEDAYTESVREYLSQLGYQQRAVLLERKYTRDCLYER